MSGQHVSKADGKCIELKLANVANGKIHHM